MNEIRLLHVIVDVFCGCNNNFVSEQNRFTSFASISIMGQSANLN